ncbi:NADH-quinone oxidoreductase subunit 5 family protein [Serinicoccus kebangsaanensis]|uniref:NADH-quinone oxidoreductase subunit 5 family protein n=1 Tax=Serinicoccus kebangsaanensis TaxID=2602069 RepID=UPI00124D838A|nr:proton-conducting transporter membrane subunit [Serinicoccus kebangsaanensis]
MSQSTAETALWLLVLLPALVGAALTLLRPQRAAVTASLVTAGVTAALALFVSVTGPQVGVPFMAGSHLALGVDPLSALVVPTIAVVTLLVLLFSAGEIQRSRARFHGLMLLFAAGALLTATAQTLPALLLAWEVMGATSFALVGFWWHEQRRVRAGTTAFLVTRAADLGLYLAGGAALAGGGGLALTDLSAADDAWRHVLAGGVLVAALGKAAQLPFSFWLSRAMEGPSPVSALLHSAAMVAMGGYLLLRTEPLLASTGWAGPAAAWVGASTALLLGAVALAQQDLKQLLAASTSAQLGFVVMGAGLGTVGGGAAHLVAHASTKALLFLAAGAWLNALGTKHLTGLRGVARRWPLVGWASTLGVLSLAGVAPLALWATKDAVLAAALARSPWLFAVGMAAAALSAAYSGRILLAVWGRVPAQDRTRVKEHLDEEQPGTGHIGLLERLPMLALALGAVTLGLLALPPVGDTFARALGEEPAHPGMAEMAGSAGIALLMLALVWWRPPPRPRLARHWLGLETAARTTVVVPTLALARALARFDDRVLDRGVGAMAVGAISVARQVAAVDDHRVDGLVEGLAARVRRLGQVARRPQSGQLHHYYVQAVAVLVVGVLLLLTVR